MLSKACIVGIYQRKLEEIARLGVELLVLVPPSWKDERGETQLERTYTEGYRLEVLPIALNGNFHLHWYPGLGGKIRDFRPDIVIFDMVIPKNEGLSVLNEIMTAGIPTRIVLTSDFGEREAERIAGSHGAERPLILKKPFRRNELIELLKNILDG